MSVVALLTDFGIRGAHYVASMKGVILKINPAAIIVDVTHEISSFHIKEASYILKTVYKTFPEGTIFILVVDPGVGSSREILAIRTVSNYFFVGPNNGIFSSLLEGDKILECIEVQNSSYYIQPVSNTFHGRDIMSPVGAHITKGVPLEKFGSSFDLNKLIKQNLEYSVDIGNKRIICEIQYIDSFGNLITNIPVEKSYSFGEYNYIKGTKLILEEKASFKLLVEKKEHKGIIASHFAEMPKNALLLIDGSSGFLEISLNQGNAAEQYKLKVEDHLEIIL